MISASNVTVQFGEKPLFENVSAKFSDGNRYGLIGANGCGKSTFMKVLGGDITPTSGNVSYQQGIRIGKLKQDQFAYEDNRVIDTVMMGHKQLWKIHEERAALYALPEMTEEQGIRAGELEIEYAELDGYVAEATAGELLAGAGIPVEQHHGPMSEIAPGWKLRVLLAQALFGNPDVMLLDEPTNNLDINTIRWLEHTLNAREGTMVIISHDRHFLNSVCTHMADIDYGELRMFPGNYDEYMTAATAVRERQQSENAKKKAKIAELQSFVSRFSANASKARQATSRARQIDKIVLEEVKPSSRKNPYINFEIEKKLHRLAVTVEGLSKGFEEGPLFQNFDLMIEAGERVAIIGPNGLGKTTLLRCLMQEHKPDTGTIKWAENATLGYVPQDHDHLFKSEQGIFDWMRERGKAEHDDQAIRAVLGALLFSKHNMDSKVNTLSGGEKLRMMFGEIILQKPNVIIMDEPTNHLDMESIESLNLALENFPGTIIFVSHDREFVSSVASRIIEFSAQGVRDIGGSYDEYVAQVA